MLSRRWMRLTLLSLAWMTATSVQAAGPADPAAAEKEIRAAAKRYTEALIRGDRETLLSLWADGGDIVDEYGNARPAKEVIEHESALREAAARNSDGQGVAPLQIVDNDLRFITPDVALEDGKVEVDGGDGTKLAGRFTAVWVKQDGNWRLASLREVRHEEPRGSGLDGLEWMVGKWQGKAGDATFEIDARWNDKHTYLMRDLTVTHGGQPVLKGQQRIGIDPLNGHIKSWMHDADGGHGEGAWSRHGDAWVVHATGVSPDGRQTSGTNIYTPHGPDSFTWKSTGATSNGQSVPDFELQLERVKADQ